MCMMKFSKILFKSPGKRIPIVVISGCEDAKIKVWTIPQGGIQDTLVDPSKVLKGKLS